MTTNTKGPAANPAQPLAEANATLLSTLLDAGYKAQVRSLNVTRVLLEGVGRQQEHSRKLVQKLSDPELPFYAAERYTAVVETLAENQNEAIRLGREYVDELSAAVAEGRKLVETLAEQAGAAQQAVYAQGLSAVR